MAGKSDIEGEAAWQTSRISHRPAEQPRGRLRLRCREVCCRVLKDCALLSKLVVEGKRYGQSMNSSWSAKPSRGLQQHRNYCHAVANVHSPKLFSHFKEASPSDILLLILF